MKKLLFIVAVVLCLPVSHLFADEWREVNADTEFLPETILVFPFGEMFDYVYVIGTTRMARRSRVRSPPNRLKATILPRS